MRYQKPEYYEAFVCTGGRCPDTCCAGWQILIDEESLGRYGRVKGSFGTRLIRSIDWYEGAFVQEKGRCAFLDPDRLCRIYKELGEEALCQTCRDYPRHTEEYEGVRELSLSLSCPEAARMILSQKEKLRFCVEEDGREEEEDFEEFDPLLFGELEEVRERLFRIVQDRSLSLARRMALTLNLSARFQEALFQGELFGIDWEEEERRNREAVVNAVGQGRYASMRAMKEDLEKLECLREEWAERLEKLSGQLYDKGEENYKEQVRRFREVWEREEWELYGEQLLMFFLYTYFCGAVYDGMVYAKAALSVFGVLWIRELLLEFWVEENRIPAFEEVVREAYSYAREIEHSDENLDLLEEFFETSPVYECKRLTDCVLE